MHSVQSFSIDNVSFPTHLAHQDGIHCKNNNHYDTSVTIIYNNLAVLTSQFYYNTIIDYIIVLGSL